MSALDEMIESNDWVQWDYNDDYVIVETSDGWIQIYSNRTGKKFMEMGKQTAGNLAKLIAEFPNKLTVTVK
jgi:WD40 repeat protein